MTGSTRSSWTATARRPASRPARSACSPAAASTGRRASGRIALSDFLKSDQGKDFEIKATAPKDPIFGSGVGGGLRKDDTALREKLNAANRGRPRRRHLRGSGIQRGYGLTKGEKRFSLFMGFCGPCARSDSFSTESCPR